MRGLAVDLVEKAKKVVQGHAGCLGALGDGNAFEIARIHEALCLLKLGIEVGFGQPAPGRYADDSHRGRTWADEPRLVAIALH